MPVEHAKRRLCIALDVASLRDAEVLIRELAEFVGLFKIGLELFCSEGPRVVQVVERAGSRVFLDLKYHDIPNTVAGAARAATRLGVAFLDVHASGGGAMMRAAANAVSEEASRLGVDRPRVLAITVLTSISPAVLRNELQIHAGLSEQVVALAKLAQDNGMDGVVASPQEIRSIRDACGRSFIILTPGIRPKGVGLDDQRRVTTPGEAIALGADYIVVGRPIVKAESRVDACRHILAEIAGAENGDAVHEG
jgi:orotidine 5''-phosphate decarboxylase, subfamily 1